MNCPDEQNLVAYADGELVAAARDAVERHLETCAACSAYVADMRGITSVGRASVARIPVPPRAPMRLENPVSSRRFIISTLAAAAVVLLATIISVRLLSRPKGGVVVQVNSTATTATTTVATTTNSPPATAPALSAPSNDELFARWAARVQRTPVRLVPMDQVANFRPRVDQPVTINDVNPRG